MEFFGSMSGNGSDGNVFVISCFLQGARDIARLFECVLRAGFFVLRRFKFGCTAWICRGRYFGFSAREGVGGMIFSSWCLFQVAADGLRQAGFLLAVVFAPCGGDR